MKSFRKEPGYKTRSKPLEDVVWSNEVEDDDSFFASHASRGKREKRSYLANIAAFGIPFIAAIIILGLYRKSVSSSDSVPALSATVKKTVPQGETSSLAAAPQLESALTQLECEESSQSITDVMPTQPEELQSNSDGLDNQTDSPANVLPDETSIDETDLSDIRSTEENVAVSAGIISQPKEKNLSEDQNLQEEEFADASSDKAEVTPLHASEEETRQAVAQLEFELHEVKAKDIRDVETLIPTLERLVEEGEHILANANPDQINLAQTTLDKVKDFQKTIVDNQDFFKRLQAFDGISLDEKQTRDFFSQMLEEATPSGCAPEITAYRKEFEMVSRSLDLLERVSQWNKFAESHYQQLDNFFVPVEPAQEAVDFLNQNVNTPGIPQEIKTLQLRAPEWKYKISHSNPTQRKIILLLEGEISQRYWTFSPSAEKFYYLPAPPKPGVNDYVADAAGTLKQVEIPENDPATQTAESLQTEFLRKLSARARKIPDSLQKEDIAKWYEEWCAFLTELQQTDRLDPILQYVLFRDVAKILAEGDYYFARRLEPLVRMLNAPQLASEAHVDRFQTDEPELQRLRNLANSRIRFLPQNHLVVDKTTAQLNAQTEKIGYVYQRVGWLDRDFDNVWRLRSPNEVPIPSGDLFVIVSTNANEKLPQKESAWYKIGTSNGRQATLKLAAPDVPRGSIIFCRVSLHGDQKVVKRASEERFFRH